MTLLAGKKVLFIGDSLSAVSYDAGDPIPDPFDSYIYQLRSYYPDMIPVDMTLGGARMSREPDFGHIRKDAVDLDVALHLKWINDDRLGTVVFELGFNDWANPPAGGKEGFICDFISLVKRIYQTFPDNGGGAIKRFIFISPFLNSDDLISPAQQNYLGETLDDYRDAILAVANYWAVFLPDILFVDGKTVPLVASDWHPDGLHIRSSGHAKIAMAISCAIAGSSFQFP